MVLSVRVVAWQLLLQAEAEAPLPIAERVRTPLGPSFRVNSLRLQAVWCGAALRASCAGSAAESSLPGTALRLTDARIHA